ncbi:MAG: hypothetical protein HOV81_22245 [Kofleriaceae bacterium]|nr:hypothetical protein [Kofleriaceae bacterium]
MSRRAARVKQIAVEHAEAVARKQGDSLYWTEKAYVDIVGEEERGDRTIVWFAFHFICLDRVQSGSDNYSHDVYGGVATFNGEKLVDVTLEKIGGDNPTEWQMEWAPDDKRYAADATFAAARDAWWARVKP